MELRRTITVTRRWKLLHFETDEGTYFVTFRLFDSLPRGVKYAKPKQIEEALDRGYGSCYLAEPPVGQLVFDALKFFHGVKYLLHSLSVMPNHLHVVFRTRPGVRLWQVLHSWKPYTSKEANRLLHRTGHFWQSEWLEWLIHDERELARANAYVMANPEKAGLKDWKWVELFDTPFYAKYE